MKTLFFSSVAVLSNGWSLLAKHLSTRSRPSDRDLANRIINDKLLPSCNNPSGYAKTLFIRLYRNNSQTTRAFFKKLKMSSLHPRRLHPRVLNTVLSNALSLPLISPSVAHNTFLKTYFNRFILVFRKFSFDNIKRRKLVRMYKKGPAITPVLEN